MQKSLKCLLLTAFMLIAGLTVLTAASMTVEWEWLLDDPEVTAYRYQLGGEDPDGWIVVSADTSTYKVEGLDPYQDYTLYIQRTYDGENWSASAQSTASAMIPEGIEAVLPAQPETVSVPDEELPAADAEVAVPETAAEEVPAVSEVPVSEPEVTASAEAPAEDIFQYGYDGYTLTVAVGDGYADIFYPSVVTEGDVDAFFAYEREKYGSDIEGITYSFIEGGVRLDLPATIDREIAKANAPVVYEDIIEFMEQPSVAEEPVQNVDETTAVVLPEAIEPVLPENDSPFAFSLLLRFGAGAKFSDTFSFSLPAAQFGIGLDFKNVIPIGNHFGFGLRSDITLDFIPRGGEWNLADNLQYFNIYNYVEASSIDLKITADVMSGIVDFYFGGGVGYSLTNPADNTDNAYFNSIHTLGSVKLGAEFSSAWFASGVLGIRFYCCDLFSIGAEVHYRYYMPSGVHYGSADLVLGFTF